MQFVQVEALEPGEAPMFDLAKSDYFKMAEIAVLFIVGLLIVLLVLRPLATQVMAVGGPQTAFAGGADQAALPQPGGAVRQLPAGEEEPEEDDDSEIDLANVEGRVKQSTLRKVGEIVDNHPDEALNIIRNWLYQEA